MTRVLLCIALTLPAQALACGMKIPKQLALTQVMEQVQEEAPEEVVEETEEQKRERAKNEIREQLEKLRVDIE